MDALIKLFDGCTKVYFRMEICFNLFDEIVSIWVWNIWVQIWNCSKVTDSEYRNRRKLESNKGRKCYVSRRIWWSARV